MKSVKCLLFVIGMFSLTGVSAQVNLRLDSVLIGLSSYNVYKDSTYTLSVTFINDSAIDFVGRINVGAAINGVIARDSIAGDAIYYPNNGVTDTVTQHSQKTHTLVLNTHNSDFIVGTSGVVIWPIATLSNPLLHLKISDTIGVTLNVLYPAGIDELSARNLKVYMSGQQLVIENKGEYQLKDVTLYDVSGKLLQRKGILLSGAVDMNEYANGVYFAEISFADNTRAVVKVVNSK